MNRPEVSIENHEAVYEFYEHLEPGKFTLNSLHSVMSLMYRPKVGFGGETNSQISEAVEKGASLIIATNHIAMTDQFPVAAVMKKEPSLQPLVGNTFVAAKPVFFKYSLIRPLVDRLGCVPVFRPQDLASEVSVEDQIAATHEFFKVSAHKLINGSSMFIFPEGTRSKDDRRIIGKVHSGVGRIASIASKEVDVAILPVGVWYGDGKKHSRRPGVYFNELIYGPFAN